MLRDLVRRAWRDDQLHPEDPHVDDLVRLLETIGLKLFESRPEVNLFPNSQVVEAIRAASEQPLPRVLHQTVEVGWLSTHILQYAPNLLRDELTKSGILVGAGRNPRGEIQFSFLHRSFLEYLSASEMARQGWDAIQTTVDRKAWLPAWQETIVMLAGRLDDPRPLLEVLADDQRDDLHRHRLALAALGLAEVGSEIRKRWPELVDQIAERVFEFWWSIWGKGALILFLKGPIDIVTHITQVLPVLVGLGPTPLENRLVGLLCEGSLPERFLAVSAVGEMGAAAATPAVIGALINCLGNDESLVREPAAEALGEMGMAAGERRVIDALIARLHDDDPEVPEKAATALGRLGLTASPELHVRVIEALIGCLDDDDSDLQGAAARCSARSARQ